MGTSASLEPSRTIDPLPNCFFDLCKGNFYGFGAVVGYGHGEVSSMCSPGASRGFSKGNAGGLNWISMGL